MRHNDSNSSCLIKAIIATETAIVYVDKSCIFYEQSTCLNVSLIPHKSILFAYGYSVYFVDENSAVKRDVISELIVHNFDVIFRLISYMDDVHRLCQICHRALPVNLGEQITETVKLVLFEKFTVEFD